MVSSGLIRRFAAPYGRSDALRVLLKAAVGLCGECPARGWKPTVGCWLPKVDSCRTCDSSCGRYLCETATGIPKKPNGQVALAPKASSRALRPLVPSQERKERISGLISRTAFKSTCSASGPFSKLQAMCARSALAGSQLLGWRMNCPLCGGLLRHPGRHGRPSPFGRYLGTALIGERLLDDEAERADRTRAPSANASRAETHPPRIRTVAIQGARRNHSRSR